MSTFHQPPVRLRRLNPRRPEIILDLKSEYILWYTLDGGFRREQRLEEKLYWTNSGTRGYNSDESARGDKSKWDFCARHC